MLLMYHVIKLINYITKLQSIITLKLLFAFSFQVQITTLCVSTSLSAYVALFCLFSPQSVHHHLPPGQERAQADHEQRHLQEGTHQQHLRNIRQSGQRKR
ncbi:hypothetical protein CEXT_195521 [Caerostris extrusa]|uniref:Uncharacterized protein n=1 Tax=Caerostris extrusa TaxID=172846 RepID=A0AAV4U3G6_CAEEX|nr:hypothetical protein CEXT_195521 [Caerostris extrusa]